MPRSRRFATKPRIWLAVLVVLAFLAAFNWSSLINRMIPADSRPAEVVFPVATVDDAGFEAVAAELAAEFDEGINKVSDTSYEIDRDLVNKIIANPNCTTMVVMMAAGPWMLRQITGFSARPPQISVVLSTTMSIFSVMVKPMGCIPLV